MEAAAKCGAAAFKNMSHPLDMSLALWLVDTRAGFFLADDASALGMRARDEEEEAAWPTPTQCIHHLLQHIRLPQCDLPLRSLQMCASASVTASY